jgi:hypothetical protein
LSNVSPTEFIAAFKRSDPGLFALFIEVRPQNQIESAHAPHSDEQLHLGYRT